MDTLKITFELSPSDLRHFKQLLKESVEAGEDVGEAQVLAEAGKLLAEVEAARPPQFIAERMEALRQLIEMMEDAEFALAPEFRKRVVAALAYFANPDDLIPDSVPVLGFLDDAIMVEIVRRELKHELDAYTDFCVSRAARNKRKDLDPAKAAVQMEAERAKLFDRIRARRRRARANADTRTTFF